MISNPSKIVPDHGKVNPRFNASLPVHTLSMKPQPYRLGLVPLPSPLRPHCIAHDCLRQWFPLQSRSARDAKGALLPIMEEDLERVLSDSSWVQGKVEDMQIQ